MAGEKPADQRPSLDTLSLISLQRVENLSDAIFAFSMTLLILGIHIPSLPKDVPDLALSRQLVGQWPEVATYILSFMNIGGYWMLHHSVFATLSHANRTLGQLNLLFLLSVTFLPFPTQLHAEYGKHPVVALAYGGTIIINYVMLLAVTWYAYQTPGLLKPDVPVVTRKLLRFRLLLPVVLAVVGCIPAFYLPRLSFLFFILVPLSHLIPARWILSEPWVGLRVRSRY